MMGGVAQDTLMAVAVTATAITFSGGLLGAMCRNVEEAEECMH